MGQWDFFIISYVIGSWWCGHWKIR